MLERLLHVSKWHKKRSMDGGISPAISSVIITGAMIVIVSVALVFANNFLWSSVAEGEFNSSKELMQTVGLQIDDVAWIVGRTETTCYSSQYGGVVFEPSVLTYTVFVETDGGSFEYSNDTGVLLFNLPTSRYTLINGYWERIFPVQDDFLVLNNTSSPVARVFAVEKVPMYDGSYIRVVVAPSIRVLSSSINASTNVYYVKMYLPVLVAGESPRLSQSITLSGESVAARTLTDVTGINVSVSFPRGTSPENFDSTFFNFPVDFEEVPVPSGYDDIVFELYLSEVSVKFGINY
jgi:hypothetical protein